MKKQPGTLADLISHQNDYLAADNLLSETVTFDTLDLLAPISKPVQVICQGLNYAERREEAALKAASKGNVMFSKADS